MFSGAGIVIQMLEAYEADRIEREMRMSGLSEEEKKARRKERWERDMRHREVAALEEIARKKWSIF